MKRSNFKKLLLVFMYLIGLWISCSFGRLIRFEHDLAKTETIVIPCINLFDSEREKAILSSGDIDSYHFVRDSISRDTMSKYPTHLFFSMVMADVYNYPNACFDVYKAISDIYTIGGIEMDNESKMLLHHYLRKGKRLGDMQCSKEIKYVEESACTKRNP